jgi:hypothetical protein
VVGVSAFGRASDDHVCHALKLAALRAPTIRFVLIPPITCGDGWASRRAIYFGS